MIGFLMNNAMTPFCTYQLKVLAVEIINSLELSKENMDSREYF